MSACGWCGHPVDCTPTTVGASLHHGLCCADQRPSIHKPDTNILARIMREDEEERWSA